LVLDRIGFDAFPHEDRQSKDAARHHVPAPQSSSCSSWPVLVETDILIIGGGLAGMSLADRLATQDRD